MSSPKVWGWRLALVAFVAGGILLWKSPYFPQERTLIWEVPDGTVSAEVQIWHGQHLLASEQRRFETGLSGPWEQKVQLPRGEYRAVVLLTGAGTAPTVRQRAFHLDGEDAVSFDLSR